MKLMEWLLRLRHGHQAKLLQLTKDPMMLMAMFREPSLAEEERTYVNIQENSVEIKGSFGSVILSKGDTMVMRGNPSELDKVSIPYGVIPINEVMKRLHSHPVPDDYNAMEACSRIEDYLEW